MSSGVSEDEIVVGEAVALEVSRAGFGRRILGAVIDVLCQIIFFFVAALVMSTVLDEVTDEALARVAILVMIVGVFVGWPVIWETATRGRSPGKFATGERVVRLDGGAIIYRQALIRGLVGFVELWMFGFGIAALAILVSRRSQRLGDMAAGTMVVRERVPLELPRPASMPAYLGAWASQADISNLGPTLAINVRQYLHRRGQLSPSARDGIAQRLCTQVSDHVSPQPPPCHPDDFLMAVLAERARRDRRRLANARDLAERLLGRSEPVSLSPVGGVGAQSPINGPHSYGPPTASGGPSPGVAQV